MIRIVFITIVYIKTSFYPIYLKKISKFKSKQYTKEWSVQINARTPTLKWDNLHSTVAVLHKNHYVFNTVRDDISCICEKKKSGEINRKVLMLEASLVKYSSYFSVIWCLEFWLNILSFKLLYRKIIDLFYT